MKSTNSPPLEGNTAILEENPTLSEPPRQALKLPRQASPDTPPKEGNFRRHNK